MSGTSTTSGRGASLPPLSSLDFRPLGNGLKTACMRVPPFSPAAVFERAQPTQRFLWQQPAGSFAVVGVGAALLQAADPESPAEGMRAAWRRAFPHPAVDSVEAPALPVAFLAQPFFPDSGLATSAGAAGGFFCLPRLLFSRRHGDYQVTIVVAGEGAGHAHLEQELSHLLSGPRGPDASRTAAATEASGISASEWKRQVLMIKDEISRGNLEKAVLARRHCLAAGDPFSIRRALELLEQRYSHCTIFSFGLDDHCFLGATPERLVRLDQGRASVDCVAGSVALGATPEESARFAEQILNDAKELSEHAIVATSVRQALDPLVERLEAPELPTIRQTADLQHLSTPFSGTLLPGRDIFELIERLHPTPATGGFPREEALRLLRDTEGFDRGWYAGPCGWVDSAGNGEISVAIRSALVRGKHATLYAGSGIVAGSVPEREYEETALKLRTMQWALQGN